ncbi:Rib/alpha-like domain-containing protein, partial [Gemella haemolysans]
VNVKVNVNKLSDEYNVTATEIEVNQNTPVTNGDLKAKVTATSKEGNVSGTDKISTVVPKSSISTANYGDQNITAIVTFKDGTTKPENQTVNYGQIPNPEDSVNKQGLPDGTTVIWKTPPVVNTPGSTTGEVEITYPDGSKDVITVNVIVRKVSEEFTATGTQIEVNQNEEVTSNMLKGAVNATNAQDENGNAKIAKVESKSPINTATYGNQTIQAKVTYIDGSEQDVTIPLKVKDVTDPTILTPEENKNWEIMALDKTLPVMKIKAEDNANGIGIATIEVRNLPEFLTFDESTGTIVFKEGVQEVPKIKSDNTMYGVTIIARDKAGNSTSMLVNITVWSMRGKYDPQPKPQTVDNGTVPNAEDSVDKTGLPSGTTITWKETPVVNTPGSHPTVALVTYPDGTVDEVEVPITVKKQSDTFTPTAKQPGQTAKHGSDPSAEGSINTDGLPSGTTYTWVEKPDTSTTPGSKPGKVLITYPDNSTEEVTVTVEVTPQKDDYNPQPKPQTVDNGTAPNAEDSVDKTGLPEGTTV